VRNLYKPNRYNVASIQAQQTMGGDVMQSAEEGDYVEWRDYKRVLNEIELLNGTVKYWEIEARTDHDRWLRVLEDYERLKEKSTCQAECLDAFDVKLSQAEAENARLKAEVERLTELNATIALRYDATKSMLDGCAKEIEEMEAEVERLTKAGDELHAFLINYIVESRISSAYLNKLDDGWHAAKEGKQP
jgi:chromosome segregation ATPase